MGCIRGDDDDYEIDFVCYVESLLYGGFGV